MNLITLIIISRLGQYSSTTRLPYSVTELKSATGLFLSLTGSFYIHELDNVKHYLEGWSILLVHPPTLFCQGAQVGHALNLPLHPPTWPTGARQLLMWANIEVVVVTGYVWEVLFVFRLESAFIT